MAQGITGTAHDKGGNRLIERVALTAGAGFMLAGLAVLGGNAAKQQLDAGDRPTTIGRLTTDEGIDNTTRGYDFSIVRYSPPVMDGDVAAPRGPDLALSEGVVTGPVSLVIEPTEEESHMAPMTDIVTFVYPDEMEALAAPRAFAE